MNLEKRQRAIQKEIRKLSEFLMPYRGIWAYEVLNFYPQARQHFSDQWFDELSLLSEAEELALENGAAPTAWRESSLKTLLMDLAQLEKLPLLNEEAPPSYPSWALNKVSGKKQHEISKIVGLLSLLGLKQGDHFVDIGGGKGHLSRILCLYHGLNGTTLDSSQEFQQLGIRRYHKYPKPEGAGVLHFTPHTFGDPESKIREDLLFEGVQASFGLHTCGPLALHHLKRAHKNQKLLNFGCCYQKLDPHHQTHLSRFSREERPYELSKHALTLASRGHTTISPPDYQIKKRVKLYRSALHFYLIDKGFHQEFTTVGSAHLRDYQGLFSHYAHLKLKKLGLSGDHKELEAFYHDKDLQLKLQWIYQANMIRWRFGRILEKVIVLDRTLSLLEEGFDAYCFEIFEAKLSPRNIGIIVNPARSLEDQFYHLRKSIS